MNRQNVIDEMKVLPSIDVAHEVRRRIDFIKAMLNKTNTQRLVLGISGGVDSCVCGKLAQLAIDELNMQRGDDAAACYEFIAVRLPYGTQRDELDAQLALDFIEPSQRLTVDIKLGADSIHRETCKA